jgi:hypothetical protein
VHETNRSHFIHQMLAEVAQFIDHERQRHRHRVLDQTLHSTPTNVLTLMPRGTVSMAQRALQ